jgi:hypothetical protein
MWHVPYIQPPEEVATCAVTKMRNRVAEVPAIKAQNPVAIPIWPRNSESSAAIIEFTNNL